MLIFSFLESKEEGKNQESIQSNITPDLGRHIWESDKNTGKHHKQESQEISPFPACHHKAARKREDSTQMTKNPQKKHRLGTVSKKIFDGLNMFEGTSLTIRVRLVPSNMYIYISEASL